MEIEIVKFDNNGRGIGYIKDKIVFVPKSVPGDKILVEIIKEKKNYCEGNLLKIIVPSKIRKKPICPYFDKCGGCDLMNISLSETLEYKLSKVNEIFKKNNLSLEVKDIIKSENNINYRNKVTLKIINGKVGYFQNDTHDLVEINYCYLCKESINNLIKDLNLLNILNGEIVIRSNYNNELILNIKTNDKIENIEKLVNIHKIVGIVKNDIVIYGENYFIDKINDYLFKVSYDSFFQINPYICRELFKLIESYTNDSKKILDLYCGVGTLSIVASKNYSYVLGVEIVENAIIDANLNKNFNRVKNIDFICNDTKNIVNKITDDYDLVLLDPPRSGVNKDVLEKINLSKPEKIIYVSCNPITLARDLKILLTKYDVQTIKLLDMFSWTEHCETFCVLEKR